MPRGMWLILLGKESYWLMTTVKRLIRSAGTIDLFRLNRPVRHLGGSDTGMKQFAGMLLLAGWLMPTRVGDIMLFQ